MHLSQSTDGRGKGELFKPMLRTLRTLTAALMLATATPSGAAQAERLHAVQQSPDFSLGIELLREQVLSEIHQAMEKEVGPARPRMRRLFDGYVCIIQRGTPQNMSGHVFQEWLSFWRTIGGDEGILQSVIKLEEDKIPAEGLAIMDRAAEACKALTS